MMRKRLCNKKLRSACGRSARRTAFSLAELVVAIGVLVLMLSLAGQVFNLTMQSTGQAKALTAVSQLLRVFERTIREDLRNVQPGQSLILIQGNPVNAYWTQEGMEADDDGSGANEGPATGYPHQSDPAREDQDGEMIKPRADILMIFTARKGTTYAHTDDFPDIASNLQQVVYGHAELGEHVWNAGIADYELEMPDTPAFPVDPALNDYPSPTAVSLVPAERWHLARRAVLLVPAAPPNADPLWADSDAPSAIAGGLGNEGILSGETDVVWNFNYEQLVELVPTPGMPPPAPSWYLPAIFDDAIVGGRIGGDNTPYARSQLDPTPPATEAEQLGHYFLPNCASFKVEWTLDPRSEFVAGRLDGTREIYWFDSGRFDPNDPDDHPLADLEATAGKCDEAAKDQRLWSLMCDRSQHPDRYHPTTTPDFPWEYSLSDRFLGRQEALWDVLAKDGRPNLVVFGAARRNPGLTPAVDDDDEIVPDDIFPNALRITVDVFDSERRLDRPIRHVMVVPVGG